MFRAAERAGLGLGFADCMKSIAQEPQILEAQSAIHVTAVPILSKRMRDWTFQVLAGCFNYILYFYSSISVAFQRHKVYKI